MKNRLHVEFSVVPPDVAEPHLLPLKKHDCVLLIVVELLVEVVVRSGSVLKYVVVEGCFGAVFRMIM